METKNLGYFIEENDVLGLGYYTIGASAFCTVQNYMNHSPAISYIPLGMLITCSASLVYLGYKRKYE
jgi:hypothetical protein